MVLVILLMLLLTARKGAAAVLFKSGITLDLRPEMTRALPIVDLAHKDAGIVRGAVVTSGTEGVHRDDSLHYLGLAIDIRTRDLSSERTTQLEHALRARLNGSFALNRPYQVVRERTHLHIEYQPHAGWRPSDAATIGGVG